MHWFLIALTGPVLYAVSNHLDKLILSRYIRDDSADRWVLTAFSALFGSLMLPFIAIAIPGVFAIGALPAVALMLTGALLIAALSLYYTALQRDEASYVVPFYQIIPVFTYATGFLILGESIGAAQILGGTVIIMGALVLSFESASSRMHFKTGVVLPMLLASLLLALNDVFFKFFALDVGFWTSVFWTYAGGALLGGALLMPARTRARFVTYITRNNLRGMTAASVSETLFVVAEVAMHYATLFAPVVLVSLVNAFQPAFVLIIGVILTLFFPRFGKESLARSALMQKGGALVLLIAGTYLIGV